MKSTESIWLLTFFISKEKSDSVGGKRRFIATFVSFLLSPEIMDVDGPGESSFLNHQLKCSQKIANDLKNVFISTPGWGKTYVKCLRLFFLLMATLWGPFLGDFVSIIFSTTFFRSRAFMTLPRQCVLRRSASSCKIEILWKCTVNNWCSAQFSW